MVKTSKAAKKHRELFGEFTPQLIDDPKACGSGHYLVGNYDHIKGFMKNVHLEIKETVEGSIDFSFDGKKIPRGKRGVIVFSGHSYDAMFVDDILKCLDSGERIEHWEVDKVDDDGNIIMGRLRAIVIVDTRGDCGALAERVNPDDGDFDVFTEEEKRVWKEMEKEGSIEYDDDYILGTVEDLVSCTFDPNDW